MPKILLVAERDPAANLAGSVLFRDDCERVFVSDPAAVQTAATHLLPHLVVIQDQSAEDAVQMVRQLKHAPETRRASVVVILSGGAHGAEVALRSAGASLAISAPFDPLVWDDSLERLLTEPRRRDTLIPTRFVVWPEPRDASERGTALNLSVRGMLLETAYTLTSASTLELSFELPGAAACEVVGQVVRESSGPGAARRYGVDFIVMRGNSRGEIHAFVESETGH